MLFYVVVGYLVIPTIACATPTQMGPTGLISVPSAETIDIGNVAVGVWGNLSTTGDNRSFVLPASITLGLGSYWEFYASYPNLLMNGEEDTPKRNNMIDTMALNRVSISPNSEFNSAVLGTKFRFYGKRNSTVKLAVDFNLQQRVSDDIRLDGSFRYGGRLISTYKTEDFGVHLYTGGFTSRISYEERTLTQSPSSTFTNTYNTTITNTDLVYGAGVELPLSSRFKLIAELTGSSPIGSIEVSQNDHQINKYSEINISENSRSLQKQLSGTDILEGTIGFKYFLSPYLTFTTAYSAGLNDFGNDWRVTFGFSTATGLGTFIKPVPKLPSEIKAEKDAQEEAIRKASMKPIKIIPISTRLVKTPGPADAVSKIEAPLDAEKEEIIIRNYGQIILPPQSSESRPFIPPPPGDIGGSKDRPSSRGSKRDGGSPTYGFESGTGASSKIDEKLTAYRKFRFPDIVGYFQQGRTDLTVEAKKLLSGVAEQIRTDKAWAYLRIDGYTDGIGSDKYNADLSLRRAIEVASYLISREGIDSDRIFVRGMGNSKQISDNATEQGRKMNRRFEILFLQKNEPQ